MKNQYDDLVKYYSEDETNQLWNVEFERPGILRNVSDLKGSRVLEIGAAAGSLSKLLVDGGASEVVAIDISSKMVEEMKRRNLTNVTPMQMDVSKMKKFDKQFDIVVASLSMHYVNDWTDSLSNLYANLKSGGQFIIQVHHPDSLKREYDNLIDNQLITEEWIKEQKAYEISFYHKEIITMIDYLESAGFKQIDSVINKPTEKFYEVRPDMKDYLENNNHFLILKMYK